MRKSIILLYMTFIYSNLLYAQEVVIRDATTTGNKANVSKLGTKYAVNNDPLPATTIANGQTAVTTAGVAVVLASSTSTRSVCVKALNANTGKMYIGTSSVSASNGYELPKDASVCLDVNNLNLIYIDSSVNGEKVSYVAVN